MWIKAIWWTGLRNCHLSEHLKKELLVILKYANTHSLKCPLKQIWIFITWGGGSTLYCPVFKHFHLNPVCLFDPLEHRASASDLAVFQREASFSFTAGRKQFNTHEKSSGGGNPEDATQDGTKWHNISSLLHLQWGHMANYWQRE